MAPEEPPIPAHSGEESRPVLHADGGATSNQTRATPGERKLTEQAEARINEANCRTQQAEARTEQANTRTAQAEARASLANAQTAEANTRITQADLRSQKAETRSEALRASELNYRRLFESARDGILILDADTGRITDANSFLIELLGYSRGEMVGKTVGELSPFKDVVSNQAMLERVQLDGYVRYEDLPLETWDGRRIAVEFVSNSYQAGGQKVIQCNIRDITERKRAEAELREVQRQLQETLAYSPVVIYSLSVEEGRLSPRMVNENVTRLFGFSKEETLSYEWWVEHLHPDDRERELADIPKLLAGDTLPRQYRLRHRDEHYVWVEDHRRVIHDPTGKPVGVSGVWIEITDRKSAEETISMLNRRYELILNSVAEGIHGIDLHGNITFENVAATNMLGRELHEMVGQPAHALMHHSHEDGSAYPVEKCPIHATLRDGATRWVDDEVFWRKNGTNFPVAYTSSPKRDATGALTGAVVTFEDITKRRRMEESHSRLAMSVEQVSESIVITDTDGAIIYANPAFEKTTGYTLGEALGKNPRLLKSGKHGAEFYRQMWEVLDRGEVWRGHMINRRKNGELFEEEASISPIRNATGKVVNYVAVKRDVTREMLLESQYRQSQKMESIGQLAGGIAHDFNNILAAIMMQVELAREVEDTPKPVLEGLAGILSGAGRAANLTRQLLLFSRKQVMQPRLLDLNDVVTSLVKMLRRITGETVRMDLRLQTKPLRTFADQGMIDQVLMNLVVNARDAMPGGGVIVIETAEKAITAEQAALNPEASPGNHPWFSVSDNGCGISPEILPRIFEPFFTTKESGRGTGLGLATAFGIVKQHRGWITVHSEVGRGTTFQVFLPGSNASAKDPSLAAAKPKPRGGSETILVAEDNAPLRALTGTLLRRAGYQVLEAGDGVLAEQLWKEHEGRIDLLLTDLVMPNGVDGRELARRMQSQKAGLKVIFTTGYSGEIAGHDLNLEEGQDFIQKPCDADHLLETVRNCLDG